MTRERLKNIHIVILRSLFKRGAHYAPTSIQKWQRKFTVSLWRRGIIDVWYRQTTDGPMAGPLYTLTTYGAYLASTLFPAPRGTTSTPGAEDLK